MANWRWDTIRARPILARRARECQCSIQGRPPRWGSVWQMELQGSTVLLTGATGGIGQAIARALDERGARVLLSARRAEQLEQIAAGLGGRPEALPADLTYDTRALAERAGAVDV